MHLWCSNLVIFTKTPLELWDKETRLLGILKEAVCRRGDGLACAFRSFLFLNDTSYLCAEQSRVDPGIQHSPQTVWVGTPVAADLQKMSAFGTLFVF